MMKLDESYNRKDFLNFLNDFLPDFEKDIRGVDINGLRAIQAGTYLGRSKNLNLTVFELSHKISTGARVALATDGFRIMRQSASFHALIVYCSSDSADWRLSLMTLSPEVNKAGGVSVQFSNPRRYSFLLGSEAKINTPYNFLVKKGKIIDLNDLKSRFSLEVVNKEFYEQIAELYTKLVGGIRSGGKKQHKFPGVIQLPSVSKDSQENQDFAVRLIGRLIFCWFLREKKGESDIALIPKSILSSEATKQNSDYYHSILEPLFFEILNKPQNSRKEKYLKIPFSKTPYLNGGLFSPQSNDFYSSNDEKQAVNHNTLIIPDDWLGELFEVLEQYNFTVDENTSIDVDLSIDPEMLGRIFENLLAEINPETGESARKNTGSYYTPRTIVEYMVDESLCQYLKEKTGIEEEKLRALVSYDLNDDKEFPVTDNGKEKIIEALSSVIILDPACGSGAFPIGALQKIVFMLQQVDPDAQLWFQNQLKNAAPEIRRVIEREFEHRNFDYIRKLGVIRESIFGVDIQPIATEIARLRCFLTLIVEERVDDNEQNRGIEPLPNLDFKFVTANSLIGLPSLDDSTQVSLFDDREKIDELKNLRDQYFNASGIEREHLKTEFVMAQKRLVDQLIKEHGFMGVAKAELTQNLTDWEPFTHKPSSWFDPDWMFGIKEGFDIVISNPPYLRIQGIQEVDPELARKYKKLYKSATGAFDLYVLFLEKGLDLLNHRGVLNFILPHKWVNSAFGSGIRKIICSNGNGKKMISFGAHQVFNASNYTSLLWLTKKHSNALEYFEFSRDLVNNRELEDALNELALDDYNFIDNNSLDENPWVLTDSKIGTVLKKLSEQPLRVKDVFIRIFQGIATSDDKVFVLNYRQGKINTAILFSKVLNEEVEVEKDLLRSFLMGKDVHRYKELYAKSYIVFPYLLEDGAYKLMSADYLSTNYPLGWSYLNKNKERLQKREHGIFKDSWWCFSRPQNMDFFEKQKIITPEISSGSNMTVDFDGSFFHTTKCYSLLKKDSIKEDYRFYLGILNSRLLWFFLKNTGYVLRGGYYTFKTNYLEPFPLPDINGSEECGQIVKLVDEIYKLNKSLDNPEIKKAIDDLENQIDHLVYKLYGLTSEEIKIVEEYASE